MPADSAPLKRKVIEAIKAGDSVATAMGKVKRHPKSYDYWRKTDPDFAEAVTLARAINEARRNGERGEVPEFDEFCEKYLHQPLHWHQLQWWDLMEGREPRDLHPSETFVAGDGDRLLVNTPPAHAKSTTLTCNYVVYQICKNPNVRILIVSKTREMAKKFLLQIKGRLTHPAFKEMQLAFAPEGGWKATADAWTTDMIYVGSDERDSGEKDPTVQALGIRGHIYGARADLIIIDDGVDGSNAHEFEKQIDWIQAEVNSRISASGRMIIIGTRMAPRDLYAEIQDPLRYPEGECPWTSLTQPAVLEFADRQEDWVTLWPASQSACDCRQYCNKGDIQPDENGRYPKWDGNHLHKLRSGMDRRNWALIYMQQQILEDAVFPSAAVTAAIDGQRMPGPMRSGALGHRQYGMEGLYIVAGLDPAMTENTSAVVMGVDRATKERWVLDVFDQKSVTPTKMRDLIKDWTVRYGIHEWRVEKNAFQLFLTQDPEILAFLGSRGCLLREHHTGRNKWDSDFGVASMAMLFGHVTKETTGRQGYIERVEGGLIHLPSTKESEACKRMVEQFITWAPETKNKTDIVMAPLDVATPLWTQRGWTTMGDAVTGDRVVTASGEWGEIIAKTPITREQVYLVTLADGTSLRATANHRWWVEPRALGGRLLPARWMTTEELRTSRFLALNIRKPAAWDGPDVELPVDPYVLGVWLGDGTANNGVVSSHRADAPFVRGQFEDTGFPTTNRSEEGRFGTIGLAPKLSALGLRNNKHVPDTYLHGSLKQRLSLLQGLMDSDGAAERSNMRASFTNSNKALVDSVCFLARSLGFRCNVDFRAAHVGVTPSGPCEIKDSWRVIFAPHAGTLNPFRLPRKADRVDSWNRVKQQSWMAVRQVTPDGSADTCCISVDHPTHVFLAGTDLVPTGNCWFAEIRAREIANFHGGVTHLPNKYLGRAALEGRTVVNLDVLFQEQQSERIGVA